MNDREQVLAWLWMSKYRFVFPNDKRRVVVEELVRDGCAEWVNSVQTWAAAVTRTATPSESKEPE